MNLIQPLGLEFFDLEVLTSRPYFQDPIACSYSLCFWLVHGEIRPRIFSDGCSVVLGQGRV